MRKPNSIIVLLYIFHIIHPQKQKRSVQPFCFRGQHSKGLSNRADVELDVINAISAADIAFIMSSSQAVVNWLNALTNQIFHICIIISFVIPPNSNTFSDWRRTCHVSLVKTSWRPRATTTWTFDSHVIRSCTFETVANLYASRRQANNFYLCIVLFWVGRYNKTLNDWPLGKQWVLFPLDLNVSLGFASGNIEGLGETKLTVSLGASH